MEGNINNNMSERDILDQLLQAEPNNRFYRNLHEQYQTKQSLTPRQTECLQKDYNKKLAHLVTNNMTRVETKTEKTENPCREPEREKVEIKKENTKTSASNENYYFTDKHGLKRPRPPAGFVSFKYEHKKDDMGNILDLCPQCSESGYMSSEDGFVDPKAQAFAEELKNREDLNDYDKWCQKYEDEMIKCHWSRYHTWICSHCGCIIWEDGVQGYKDDRYIPHMNYHRPKGQTILTEKEINEKNRINNVEKTETTSKVASATSSSSNLLTDPRKRTPTQLESELGALNRFKLMFLYNDNKISLWEYEDAVKQLEVK